ncbi:hypothetical protein F4779DRAFT_601798 [Xylariaceae sp. FL0662B]|nr:hypothetical protein F4779DRAFT_601798 [Xylariaceae sp. FL0662B]
MNVSSIYNVACHLLELGRTKSRLAIGRPIDVSNDISEFSFDTILRAAMGLD